MNGLSAARLRAIQAWDRARLRSRARAHPGLFIDPEASPSLAVARFNVAPDAELHIAAGVVTERIPGRLSFVLHPGSRVFVGEGTWLGVEMGNTTLVAHPGGTLVVGPECFVNGAHLSASLEVTMGRRAWVGTGCRIYDSDQHDLDAERPQQSAPVRIGDHAWVASDVTVMKGVTLGSHTIVGARSLVTRDVPDHSLAFGFPAEVRGTVGDRSTTR